LKVNPINNSSHDHWIQQSPLDVQEVLQKLDGGQLDKLSVKLLTIQNSSWMMTYFYFKSIAQVLFEQQPPDYFYNQYGLLLLLEKHISVKDIEEISFEYTSCEYGSTRHSILSANGLKAFRNKLIQIEHVRKNPFVWKDALTDQGLVLLEEGLITGDQLVLLNVRRSYSCIISLSQMRSLATPNGKFALVNHLLTPEDAIDFPNLDGLLSDNGIIALSEKLITITQAKAFFAQNGSEKYLQRLMQHSDILMIFRNEISIEQILKFKEKYSTFEDLELLLSPRVRVALKNQIFQFDDILHLNFHASSAPRNSAVAFILSENVLNLLENKIIHLSEFTGHRHFNIEELFDSPWGLLSLQKKHIIFSKIDPKINCYVMRVLASEWSYIQMEARNLTADKIIQVANTYIPKDSFSYLDPTKFIALVKVNLRKQIPAIALNESKQLALFESNLATLQAEWSFLPDSIIHVLQRLKPHQLSLCKSSELKNYFRESYGILAHLHVFFPVHYKDPFEYIACSIRLIKREQIEACRYFLNEYGLCLILSNLMSIHEALSLNESQRAVISANGYKLLSLGLVTIEHVILNGGKIWTFAFSDTGTQLIEDKVITSEQLLALYNPDFWQELFSMQNMVIALEEGLFTIEDFHQYQNIRVDICRKSIQFLLSNKVLDQLRTGEMTKQKLQDLGQMIPHVMYNLG